jgi:hypothetical protein
MNINTLLGTSYSEYKELFGEVFESRENSSTRLYSIWVKFRNQFCLRSVGVWNFISLQLDRI